MDLSDVRVLDLSVRLPGPFATQLLADLGADVLSVEPPDGDPTRHLDVGGRGDAIFASVNRGKRSVALDLKSSDGKRAFDLLASDVDVVVEGFRPGTAARLGVDYESVAADNPEVVYCSISGFGQTGPSHERPAHGLTVAGMAGFLDQNRREPDAPPAIPGFSVADQSAGLVATLSVLAGILSRELGGGGCHVDTAMLEAVLSLSGNVAPLAVRGTEPTPGAGAFTGRDPWYDVYECADGRYVTLAALERTLWESFCESVDRRDLVHRHGTTDPAVREALRAELTDLFGRRARDEWIERLPADSIVGPVNTVSEALEAEHVGARDVVKRQGSPRVGFPAMIDGVRPDAGGDVPSAGEHTAEVLREAGAGETLVDRITGE